MIHTHTQANIHAEAMQRYALLLLMLVVLCLSLAALYTPMAQTTTTQASHQPLPSAVAMARASVATATQQQLQQPHLRLRQKLLPAIGSEAIKMFAEPPPLPPLAHRASSSSPPPPTPPPKRLPLEPAGAAPSSAKARCESMQTQHSVVVGASWGSLTPQDQQLWTALKCDAHVHGLVGLPSGAAPSQAVTRPAVAALQGDDAFTRDYKRRLREALASRPATRRLSRPQTTAQSATARPLVIAVCACTTSRGLKFTKLEQFTLFNLMLPSLLTTLRNPATLNDPLVGTRGSEPFELWLYLAFDAGDAFYDQPAREAEVNAWLDAHLVKPLADAGVRVRHALLRFENTLRKPGPAFNFMMAAAAEDGADYLYRINDDTQFATAWLPEAVRTLRGYSPPNVGVVGPVCHEGNTRILTHDLVHRTHLEIFELYYPAILSDWWMDDWITKVYGPARTTKGPWLVRHLWTIHGTRYSVDHSHERRLSSELVAGQQRIVDWLALGKHQ